MTMSDIIDEMREAEGLESYLEYLLDIGVLSGAAEGIAKQATTKGIETLSDRQIEVVNSLRERHPVPICPRCQGEIPMDELRSLFLNDVYCSYCADKMSKDD